MRILVLEDDPQRHDYFRKVFAEPGDFLAIVERAEDAILALVNRSWDLLCLDHDLGHKVNMISGPGTGYEVAVWLEEHPERIPGKVIIHSYNPVGADLMNKALPNAKQIPGAWLYPARAVLESMKPIQIFTTSC